MKKRRNLLYNLALRLFSRIGKRKRFIFSTAILTLLVLSITFYSFSEARLFIPIALFAVYVFTFFSILEGITRREWITLFIPPLYFTLVFTLFYFFLPQRWLTRLPFVAIYAISIYAIMLSQNIFNVGALKSLQLFRAAFSVNYLFLTFSSFLAYSLILSFRSNFLINGAMVALVTAPLALHFLWSVNPQDTIEKRIIAYSVLISLLVGEAGVMLSFMPVNGSIFALFLTSFYYSVSGLTSAHMQEMLFRERVREYVAVLGFVFFIVFLSLGW
ncbi:MAG: hypothetical protein ACE5DQ_00540 [Candidatus Paceibacterota bacterium]